MDDFIKGYESRCGVGGRKCFCCNNFGKGKSKKKLTRIVRRTIKDKDKKTNFGEE